MAEQSNKLGEILLRAGVISESQLEQALETQKKSKGPLGKVLVDNKLITEDQLAQALAEQKGLSVLNLSDYNVNPHAAYLISEKLARERRVFAFDLKDNVLYLAMANPLDIQVADDIRVMTGYVLKQFVATETDITALINLFFKADESVKEAVESAVAQVEEVKEEDIEVGRLRAMVREVPIVRLANRVISQAVDQRASDIHVEPGHKEVVVRFRVDGVLHEVMKLPRRIQPAFISRLKIMSDLDIAERRIPQSGGCNLLVSGKNIDLRVTTLPTAYGENVVIRILDKSQALYSLEDLGFDSATLKKYAKAFSQAYGTILVTGPTGSGKTTTLYATLNKLNVVEKKIVTIEDPVEYQLPGITQIQVRPKAGLDFATALRAIVRADPDTIMIGEIRDLETAQIAMRSAMTGHLVLSTLHTNDAPGAVERLIDMGLEPFFISSVICVVAQRLARKLCPYCKEKREVSAKEAKEFGFDVKANEKLALYWPKGCRRCLDSGYRGRVGIFEFMMISEEIVKLSMEEKSSNEIRKVAVAEGMRLLREDGLEKARQGITSIDEVLRVVV